YACQEISNELTQCYPDSLFTYQFDFTNYSAFTIDRLQVWEDQTSGLILQEELTLPTPLPPGATATGLGLQLSPAAEGLPEFCFALTSRRTLNDTISVDCCTENHCIDLPLCDRCCTDYEEFVADLNVGFIPEFSCADTSLMVRAPGLTACDRARWRLLNLSTNIAVSSVLDGDETFIYLPFGDETEYELCLTATRQDLLGVNCYEPGSLTICDTISFDCDFCIEQDQIDWNYDCPPEIDLVCACDSMTYLNACAAEHWAGATDWNPGTCGDPPVDTICLNGSIDPDTVAHLDWFSLQGTVFRQFIVQRQLPPAGPWVTLNVVDGNTDQYDDDTPLVPSGNYRVVGVTFPGKVVFSKDTLLVDANELRWTEGGQLWPIPAREELHLRLPWTGSSQLQLYNAQGQILTQQLLLSALAQLPLRSWPPGYYTLVAIHRDGRRWRHAFILQP
ncbi:MAG: hypothetical protein KDC54_22925, partial [Lewinella sp.]|nr:hypothetical protein [Lewinella sp.]